eukprot:SAG22_NODE_243_length_14055_cov_3.073015_13_plen_113_part_00
MWFNRLQVADSGHVTLRRRSAGNFVQLLSSQAAALAVATGSGGAGRRAADGTAEHMYILEHTYSRGQPFGVVESVPQAKTNGQVVLHRYCTAETTSLTAGAELLHLDMAAIG